MTADEIRSIFEYCPDDGHFRYRRDVRCGKNLAFIKATAGSIAGNFQPSTGYWMLSIKGRRYAAHRMAFLYMTGELPALDVDHIDGNRCNNRWDNLRQATRAENMQNLKRAHSDSLTGFLGVERKRGRFAARIAVRGKRHNLGVFDTAEAAHAAYVKAKRHLHERGTL